MRRTDEFEGASVRDDGVEDVLIASSGDVVVVHADVGGFGAFSGVLGAAALVGCGEVFEGFAAGVWSVGWMRSSTLGLVVVLCCLACQSLTVLSWLGPM